MLDDKPNKRGQSYIVCISDVKSSRPKWPRGQNFGLGLKDLAWPQPQTFGLSLALILLSYYVIGHFSGKNCVKFRNLLIFPAIIINRMLLIIIWYFFIIIFGLCLGLNLQKLALASASASTFWACLTSLRLQGGYVPLFCGQQCSVGQILVCFQLMLICYLFMKSTHPGCDDVSGNVNNCHKLCLHYVTAQSASD